MATAGIGSVVDDFQRGQRYWPAGQEAPVGGRFWPAGMKEPDMHYSKWRTVVGNANNNGEKNTEAAAS